MLDGGKVSAETWLKLGFALVTGIAAVLGVQLSPAAKPEDVSAVVRSELAPLKIKVDSIAEKQDAQERRLTAVESKLSSDATSTKE